MSKGGYDQFFKAAKRAKAPSTKNKFPLPKPDAEETIRKALKMRSAKRAKPFPFVPVLCGAVLISAGIGYLAKPDLVDQLVQRVQVRAVGQVEAEEKPAKDSGPAAATAAKDAAANSNAKKSEPQAKDQSVAEDTSYIDKLRTRKEELDLREKELNQLEEELQRQKVEVDQRIRQLEQMRRDIASVLKERMDADETQVNKLVDLYSTMKPKQAADVIGSLQEDLAVQILGKMKKKNAAEVMNVLPADKARALSEKLTGYKR
jgi:flagellar motility protein MotE (MotC chaperone)